ncbi:MAG TPA: hypothetical protein VID03_09010 [Acidimicrobiia bacterium]|jgi:hypothetical protein
MRWLAASFIVLTAVVALGLPQMALGATRSLMVSSSPNRSSPSNLAGKVVLGKMYVFAFTDTAKVTSVDFWVDDPNRAKPRVRRDTAAPYDLKGGTGSAAIPYDTVILAEGVHTVTARFNYGNGPSVVIHATFTVDNVPGTSSTSATSPAPSSSTTTTTPMTTSTSITAPGGRRLVVSMSPGRTSPANLQGATLEGNVYVFTTPDTASITSVEFWLDDPNRTGPRSRLEGSAPYDFGGGTVQLASPFSTLSLTEGPHTITARFNLSGASPVVVHGVFEVDNFPATTTTAPISTTVTTTAPSTTETTVTLPPPASLGIDAVGERFYFDGVVTNQGSAAEGLLLNSRMILAISDIGGENGQFVYPDTLVWDAERNVSEFLSALPSYAAAGLDGMTIGMQGGNPSPAAAQDYPPWVITGYESDGTPKAEWLDRLDRVIRAARSHGMVVIVSLFYFGQDDHLADEAAIVNATDRMTDWLTVQGYDNVIVEIANESNTSKYDHSILQPERVAELITRVRNRAGGVLMVGTSFTGGAIPPDAVVAASDLVLVHGNNQSPSRISSMITTIRGLASFQAAPKPIVFNEDSTTLANFAAALNGGASWGFYEKGTNDYLNGYQAPPVNWSIGTASKQAFFDQVGALTSSG